MQPRILVVDDDAEIRASHRRGLLFAGFEVALAADGAEALGHVRDAPPDLVVLDLMMPGLGGLEVLRRLRAADDRPPVVLLTARDAVPDRVAGLEAGADDYLVKPFAFDELLARVRVRLRRREPDEAADLRFADLSLDTAGRQASRGDRPIALTTTEYELLRLFLLHPRRVLTRDRIYERVWGYEFVGESKVIEVYVRHLRKKLEAAGEPRLIQTVRGAGYLLRETPERYRSGSALPSGRPCCSVSSWPPSPWSSTSSSPARRRAGSTRPSASRPRRPPRRPRDRAPGPRRRPGADSYDPLRSLLPGSLPGSGWPRPSPASAPHRPEARTETDGRSVAEKEIR